MTSDEDIAFCARSDRLLGLLLGRDLQQATLRLGLIGLAVCAILAFLSEIVA
ncbi:MAG: hypothetical protein ACREFL_18715 [Stellaceae bacterium]